MKLKLTIFVIFILNFFNKGYAITGGQDAAPNQFPFEAALFEKHVKYSFCGGSIISNETILTTKSCLIVVGFLEDLVVKLGINSLQDEGQEYYAEQFIPHPTFDLGLIKLTKPISLGENIKTVQLPSEKPDSNRNVTLSGFGWSDLNATQPKNLQFLNVKTISNEECKKWYSNISDQYLCTFSKAGEGECIHDNGGPVVEQNVLIGVIVGGMSCGMGFPDYHVPVFDYLQWIHENIT